MLIACFLNSLGTGSGLRCSVWHWAGQIFEVAVDLLWLDFYSSFSLCFDPSLISSMQLLTCSMHCDNKKKNPAVVFETMTMWFLIDFYCKQRWQASTWQMYSTLRAWLGNSFHCLRLNQWIRHTLTVLFAVFPAPNSQRCNTIHKIWIN